MLEVVLGTVFILLVLSLFATTIMEIINSLFSLRGKFLIRALKSMLAGDGRDELYKSFIYNPRYKQLTSKFLLKERPPSYISSSTFSSILWDELFKEGKEGSIEEKIKNIKDNHLQAVLMQLLKESDFQLGNFKEKVEVWYDEVMERSIGWFKRNTQTILLLIGLFIAIFFDADTLSIFRQLSNNPESQLKIAGMVDNLYAQDKEGQLVIDSAYLAAYQMEIQALLSTNLEGLREPLGLGWYESTSPKTNYEWFLKVMGWLITALAISLGAPFWFDLLKKVMSIRNTGYIPNKMKQEIPMPVTNHYQMGNQGLVTPLSKGSQIAQMTQKNTTELVKGIKSYG